MGTQEYNADVKTLENDAGKSAAIQRYAKYLGLMPADEKIQQGNADLSASLLNTFAGMDKKSNESLDQRFLALQAYAKNSAGTQPPLGSSADAVKGWQQVADDVHKEQAAMKTTTPKPTAEVNAPKTDAAPAPKGAAPKEPAVKEAAPKSTHHFNHASAGIVADADDLAFQADFEKKLTGSDFKGALDTMKAQDEKINDGPHERLRQQLLIKSLEKVGINEDLGSFGAKHDGLDGRHGKFTHDAEVDGEAKLQGRIDDTAAKAKADADAKAKADADAKAKADAKPAAPAAPAAVAAVQPKSTAPQGPVQPQLPVLNFQTKQEAQNGFYRLEQNPALIGAMITHGHSPYDVMAGEAHKNNGEAYLADANNHFVARYDMKDGQFLLKGLYDTTNPSDVAKLAHDQHNDELHSDKNAIKWSEQQNQPARGYNGAAGGPVAYNTGGPSGYVAINVQPRGEVFVGHSRPFSAAREYEYAGMSPRWNNVPPVREQFAYAGGNRAYAAAPGVAISTPLSHNRGAAIAETAGLAAGVAALSHFRI